MNYEKAELKSDTFEILSVQILVDRLFRPGPHFSVQNQKYRMARGEIAYIAVQYLSTPFEEGSYGTI